MLILVEKDCVMYIDVNNINIDNRKRLYLIWLSVRTPMNIIWHVYRDIWG